MDFFPLPPIVDVITPMKIYLLILLSPCLLYSCLDNTSSTNTTQKKEISPEKMLPKDTILSLQDSLPKISTKSANPNSPCLALQEFALDLEKMGWVADTTRLQKLALYRALNREQVQFFEGRPFYPIAFEDSRLNQAYDRIRNNNKYSAALDMDLFRGATSIWGYFYRAQAHSSTIVDGVLEQWVFESEVAAQKALEQISTPRLFIYVNTQPYFCRLENKLIIFQARASAFSYAQKPLFEQFVQDKGAVVVEQ